MERNPSFRSNGKEKTLLFPDKLFKVCAKCKPGDEEAEVDYTCLPLFVQRVGKAVEGTHIQMTVTFIHIMAPDNGYMIKHRENSMLYQKTLAYTAYFFPLSNAPMIGLQWFPTRQEAIDYLPNFCNEDTGLLRLDFEVVPYDHELQEAMYQTAKPFYTWEPRLVTRCPICRHLRQVTDVQTDSQDFRCVRCEKEWQGAYCPVTGKPGFCPSDCECWRKELDPEGIYDYVSLYG